MAFLPTKTYSKRIQELSVLNDREKENIDPFDELLSSPLKQDVQFQPLSYWGKKVKDTESRKKSNTIKYGLFETSDSDEGGSPFRRKRKPKSKYLVSKPTKQIKDLNMKLSARRSENNSTASIKQTKFYKSTDESKSFMCIDKVGKTNKMLSNETVYFNENMEETLVPCKVVDNFKFESSCFNFTNTVNGSIHSEESKDSFAVSKYKKNNFDNLSFKIYEDTPQKPQKPVKYTIYLNESMEETIKPFFEDDDTFKFISIKRNFNYPRFCDMTDDSLSFSTISGFNKNQKHTSQPLNTEDINAYKDNTVVIDAAYDMNNNVEDNDDDYFINNTLVQSSDESMDRTFYSVNSTTVINPKSKEISVLGSPGESIFSPSNRLDFEIEDLIQELLIQQNANAQNSVIAESSSTSDDTLSEPNDDTVIRVTLKPETVPASSQGPEEDITSVSTLSGVSQLTSKITDLNISKKTEDELPEPVFQKSGILQSKSKNTDEDSFLSQLQNVTTKRRGFLNNRFEENMSHVNSNRLRSTIVPKNLQKENSNFEFELDQTFEFPRTMDKSCLEWNETVSFSNPIFESTRVLDSSIADKKVFGKSSLSESIVEESTFDHTYALKPGKKWVRSLSVLRQLQNGNISDSRLEGTIITEGKLGNFVQDVMDMRNDSLLSKTALEKTMLEKTLLSHTVKVIEPQEGSSAFRSALGLESSYLSSIQEDSVPEEIPEISARDFILIQCGQEDVLPFEEYFNEKTLQNCKKIGEGVYGEVFMCSNTVIKIIPIEGSDKVNGEPQKTFEEIISEVVIASKLSQLRNGENHRTDGFSEMKRCWCVKGKYPKHLINLWNDYDKSGSGSENDSPVMFKDDQLYIILELANGGKDLESFAFMSAAQSLSIFIQAAFSLAVAEKAFEFEHRDLHWGNVLISETKDKFMTVVLDGIEYKIPTKGVKVCIIDFTLSRMNHEGCCIFNDLSVDPGLFASEGDYQFEIYRMMLREVNNDWSLFRPKNNLFWLHYMLDKMIKLVYYKNKKAKVHLKHLKDIKSLESVVLEHEDSTSFVLSSFLVNIMNKL